LRRVSKKSGPKAIELREWHVTLIRYRGEFLGYVKATNREAAEIAALQSFNLKQSDRKRLIVRERAYFLATT
jgi:hypothetical protein